MKNRPITPDEVADAKQASFPDEVFQAFNGLIAEKFSGGRAVVKQDDVVERIVSKLDCTRQEVFNKGWLNVEEAYRKAGWIVEYDKPGYNETYDAFFTFKQRRGGE